MPLGYESYARITKNAELGGGTATLLCSSASAPLSVVRLESSGAYGGSLNVDATRGLGRPHNYGYPIFEATMNNDLHANLLSTFLKPWIVLRRDLPYSIDISARAQGMQRFSNSYWRKIGFSTSSGSQVVTEIEFISEAENLYNGGGKYFENIFGQLPEFVPPISPPFLNPPTPTMLNADADKNNNPIPFWNTQVKFDEVKLEGLIDWHLDFQQDISFFFTCENTSDPIGPSFMAVGIMNAVFGGNVVLTGEDVPNPVESIEVIIGQSPVVANGNRFLMYMPERNQRVDPIVGISSTPIHSFEHTLYNIQSDSV